MQTPYWHLLRRCKNNPCNQTVSRASLWFASPSSFVVQTTTNQRVAYLLSLYPYRTRDSLLGNTVTGEVGWFVIFLWFKSILFFVNWISLYLFTYLVKYHFMFINNVFWLGRDRLSGLLSFVPAVLFPYLRLSSFRLRLSHGLISFLLFPWASVWENTRAWVPRFLNPYWMVLHFLIGTS